MCTGNSKSCTTCLLRLCRNFCYARSTLQVYDRSAAKWIPPDEESASLHESMYGPKGWVTLKLQKQPSTLSIGTRVYCLWPDNKAWYWGRIYGCRPHREKRFYKVVFDDGDERTDVRRDEFVTENEYQPPPPAAEDRKRPARLTPNQPREPPALVERQNTSSNKKKVKLAASSHQEDNEEFDSSKLRKKYTYMDSDTAYLWDDNCEQADDMGELILVIVVLLSVKR